MMLEGGARREKIEQLLQKSRTPVSGSELAKRFGVSRQVIVQDIALLRATDKNILSTNKGYVLFDPAGDRKRMKRTMAVCHDDSRMREELYLIVDNGGTVLDVVVEHELYGQITVDLILKNRRDVDDFADRMERIQGRPLKELTGGMHFHTVEADTEETLDRIEAQLQEKGFWREIGG